MDGHVVVGHHDAPVVRAHVDQERVGVDVAAQPVAELGEICRRKGVRFLVDASQTAGVLPIDVQAMTLGGSPKYLDAQEAEKALGAGDNTGYPRDWDLWKSRIVGRR